MKKIQLIVSSLLLASICFSAQIAFAQKLEKRVDKTFKVNNNTRLVIENRFGKVHINTWDQNTIEVKVLIEAEGSEAVAKDILDRITIDIDESPDKISLETEIENAHKKWRDQRFKIDYTVKMPKSNPLTIDHRHGDIYLDNFSGPLDLELAHGQIIAEELTGKALVTLRHGSGGRISSIGSGSLEIQHYQRLRIGKMGNLELEVAHAILSVEEAGDLEAEVRHSTFSLEKGGALDMEFQHSKLSIGAIRSLRTDMQHSTVAIEKLQQLLDVSSNHGEVEIDHVGKGFTSIQFDGNHSYLGMGLESGASASVRANLHYGKFHYIKSEINMSLVNIEDQRSEYKGTIGSNPQGEIRVEGSYTDCSINLN